MPAAVLIRKAFPALVVGIAFFLLSCQARLPEGAGRAEVMEDRISLADSLRRKGELERALDAYSSYLEKNPRGRHAPAALHHMAEIHFDLSRFDEAESLSRRLISAFPDYPDLPRARLLLVEALNARSEYTEADREALAWLKRYPGHEARADVLNALAENASASGRLLDAFRWWFDAARERPGDRGWHNAVGERLRRLVETADEDLLGRATVYAEGSGFAAFLHERLANLYLARGDLTRAEQAAMAMIRATSEQPLVDRGRRLLERIQQESSVNRKVVGCLLPLSGPFAMYGEEILNGIQLGLGLAGDAELELVIRDTGARKADTESSLRELAVDEKVIAAMGPLASKTAAVAAEKSQALGVPLITFSQKEGLAQIGDMVFRNFLVPSREVSRLLETAIRRMGIQRFAVLYPDNSYGSYFMNLFWDRVERMGGAVTAVESYDPGQTTDFADQIRKMTGRYYPRPDSLEEVLKERMPADRVEWELSPEEPEPIVDFEAIFIPDTVERVALIAPQLVYYDVGDQLLLGTSLWHSPKLLELAGDYVQEALFPVGFFPGSEEVEVKAFVANYRELYEAEPSILAATGYDTMRVIKEVLRDESVRSRADARDALLALRGFRGVTGTMSFDPEGEVEKVPFLLRVSGDRLVSTP